MLEIKDWELKIGEERIAYELEMSTFLIFQIKSALFSLEQILQCNYPEGVLTRCQTLHYFTDHLLHSWGQIASRISSQGTNKKTNCYCPRLQYHLLSSKDPRNFLEHIDERNDWIIRNKLGVGGFNYIDEKSNPSFVEALTLKRELHPYTLNLKTQELWLFDKGKVCNFPLVELKKELHMLLDEIEDFDKRLKGSK